VRVRDRQLAALDKFIDHDPDNTRPIRVTLSPTALGKLLGKLPVNGEFTYRNRVIVAQADDPVAARFLGGTL
jgi:hypothetical protein